MKIKKENNNFANEENKKNNNNTFIKSNLFDIKNYNHKTFYSRNNKYLIESSKELLNRKIKNKNINNKKNILNTYNKYFYDFENNKLNILLFNESKRKNNEYSKNNNTFSKKTINFIKNKYYGNIEKVDCVMPANNLRNIIIKNENAFFFKTNYPSKISSFIDNQINNPD